MKEIVEAYADTYGKMIELLDNTTDEQEFKIAFLLLKSAADGLWAPFPNGNKEAIIQRMKDRHHTFTQILNRNERDTRASHPLL